MTLQATLKRVDYAFNRWFKGLAKRPKDGKHEATRTDEASETQSYWSGCRNPDFNEVGLGSSSVDSKFPTR